MYYRIAVDLVHNPRSTRKEARKYSYYIQTTEYVSAIIRGEEVYIDDAFLSGNGVISIDTARDLRYRPATKTSIAEALGKGKFGG